MPGGCLLSSAALPLYNMQYVTAKGKITTAVTMSRGKTRLQPAVQSSGFDTFGSWPVTSLIRVDGY